MPLRCLSNTVEMRAFELDDPAWASLKESYRSMGLRMPCCDTPAIPKTSSLGTHFFAHSRRAGCTSAPETKEHILAKTIIAKTVLTAGWGVQTECAGRTPEGEDWIADVLASKDRWRIAFEVQWTSQDENETRKRQKRYADSGVRGLWLFRQADFVSDKEVPGFYIEFDGNVAFNVGIPEYYGETTKYFRSSKYGDDRWQQKIDLERFIRGVLQRDLKWAPAIGGTFPVKVQCADTQCWKCKKETSLAIFLEVDIASRYPGHPNAELNIYDFEDDPALLQEIIPEGERVSAGIGMLKPRFSRTMGETYLSNGCRHCDAIQGKFFDHDHFYETTPKIVSKITLTPDLIEKMKEKLEDVLMRWYLDINAMD
jgi:competence protein CoiA